MNDSSNFSTAERLESLKAGTLAALSLLLAFVLVAIANNIILPNWEALTRLQTTAIDLNLVVRCAIASISGFLFGVTYRYAIRRDTNPQLKAGVVLAFGLVRGLAQVDVELSGHTSILLAKNIGFYAALALESMLMFAIAAIVLDFTIQRHWIEPFNSN
ncbi:MULTISPECIES: hypothetical protein [Kamptonema]|uniref:hypothetical protein n=1 Tax=Kamptonema TaxID=1501433 RepID=UPI0001DAD779|nr:MULTISPECIES: hypothetical protein [Kamptonema]CBN55960.1 conserved membrane hypothetical protein [Kamptonema sp. PCC 6506]